MAIPRRIFRKQYKRPKPRRALFSNNKIKFEINHSSRYKLLKVVKKSRSTPLYRFLNIREWNTLSQQDKLREYTHACRDIHVFARHYVPRHKRQTKKNLFQAYLPNELWKKMSKQERRKHLQKRSELTKKGEDFFKRAYNKIQYKAYFINARIRPVLKNMSSSNKINYLKILIARAKMHAVKINQEIKPKISKISPSRNKRPLVNQQLINFYKFNKVNSFVRKNVLISGLTPSKPNKKKHV